MERVRKKEAFSLFILPNGFCAFCAFLFFLSGVVFLEAVGAKPRSDTTVALSFLCTAAFAAGIYFSGAKGGILILIFVILLVGVSRFGKRINKEKLLPLLLVVLLILVVGILVLVVPPERLPPSVSVRAMYWRSALKMVFDNPCGVGLGNFAHFYGAYKDIRAEDVKCAHNILVTFATEAGPIASCFLALLIFLIWRSVSGEWHNEESKGKARIKFLSGAFGGSFALLLSCILGFTGASNINPPNVLFALSAVWLLLFLLFWRADFLSSFKRWRTAVVGAFFIGVFSCLIDFNGNEGPFTFSLSLLCALGFSASGASCSDKVADKRNLFYVAGCGIFAVVFALFVPDIMEVDVLRLRGSSLVKEGLQAGKEGELLVLKGVALLGEAADRAGWNFHGLKEYADAQKRVYKMRREESNRKKAIAAYRKVIEANPRDSSAYKFLSSLYEQGGEVQSAFECIRTALSQRKVEPRYWLEYGRLLWKLRGKEGVEEAVRAFQEALRLDATEGAWNRLEEEERRLARLMIDVIGEQMEKGK
ncbi:MAG: hypothetical protein N2234_08520 [Planctomycetota bacterium]|nr:hypothetical protein [Planctomycetota bacterium]